VPIVYLCPSCLAQGPIPGKCQRCRRTDYREDRAAQLRSSSAWQKARARAKRRDGFKCVVCGSTDRLEVDHIVPLEHEGPAFDLDNLRTVCSKHNPAWTPVF
jgi:5-methylcytosine-specific restriction endonuclease McrA